MSTTAGLLIGLGAIALAFVVLRRHGESRDLGCVSRGWILEHRLSHSDRD